MYEIKKEENYKFKKYTERIYVLYAKPPTPDFTLCSKKLCYKISVIAYLWPIFP